MIGGVLSFVRRHLSGHLHAVMGAGADQAAGDKVVFVDGDKMDPIVFPAGAVSELLINIEEERVLRDPDRYAQRAPDGSQLRVQPDIRLVLYVLFVARFKQYEMGWEHLSKIVEHFQSERVFDRETHPDLPAGVERLVLELVTLDFAAQNEVWNALRTTHHPSVLYRIKLLALRDQQPQPLRLVDETILDVRGSK